MLQVRRMLQGRFDETLCCVQWIWHGKATFACIHEDRYPSMPPLLSLSLSMSLCTCLGVRLFKGWRFLIAGPEV